MPNRALSSSTALPSRIKRTVATYRKGSSGLHSRSGESFTGSSISCSCLPAGGTATRAWPTAAARFALGVPGYHGGGDLRSARPSVPSGFERDAKPRLAVGDAWDGKDALDPVDGAGFEQNVPADATGIREVVCASDGIAPFALAVVHTQDDFVLLAESDRIGDVKLKRTAETFVMADAFPIDGDIRVAISAGEHGGKAVRCSRSEAHRPDGHKGIVPSDYAEGRPPASDPGR